jgi:hypothetical protein
MGVTAEDIADGEDGKVLWFGRLRGLNTNAFNEGDILYASTTSAGGFQTAIPTGANNIVQVSAVIKKSINQGVIFIRPQIEPLLENPNKEIRHDWQDPYSYCGIAPNGSLETEENWTIKRIQVSLAGTTTILTATDVAWTDRTTVIYS